MELETDKAVVEVPSSVSGTVKEIRVKEGEKVKVGQVIFTVENGAGASQAVPAEVAPAKAAQPAPLGSCQQNCCRLQAQAVCSPAAAACTGRVWRHRNSNFPNWARTFDQGDLVRLMISPGTKVSEGQPVMELETDKAVVEVPSSVSGVVKEVRGQRRREGQSRPGDLYAGRRRRRRRLRRPSMRRSSTFPGSKRRGWRFRPRSRPKARPKSRRCLPDQPQPSRRRASPCRRNWAKWQARSIASRFRPRRMFGAWRANWASTSTM